MAALAFLLVPLTAQAEACQGYPIDRCGSRDRESVVFCYVIQGGKMVSSTTSAQTLGAPGHEVLQVRTAPMLGLLADPMNAPLPFGTLWQEANGIPGLQTTASTCGTFEWWAECGSWMGPYNQFAAGTDTQLA